MLRVAKDCKGKEIKVPVVNEEGNMDKIFSEGQENGFGFGCVVLGALTFSLWVGNCVVTSGLSVQ